MYAFYLQRGNVTHIPPLIPWAIMAAQLRTEFTT